GQPPWLSVAVPVASIGFSFLVIAAVLGATGHDPLNTYRRLFDAAFVGTTAWSFTLESAMPILFTGLAAAVAFRMQLFNIGAEGQLYLGALGASWIALKFGDHGGKSEPLYVIAMCFAGGLLGALWSLLPGVLRAFAHATEIITSL